MALVQILFRIQQQVHHEPDHLARGEVLPRLLVRLFRADPDQLLEHPPHLHVADFGRGKVDLVRSEFLVNVVKQVLLGHLADLHAEVEPLKNISHIGRKCIDVTVEVRRQVVRVVKQRLERHPGEVVKRHPSDLL
ncbi:hypothetical protein SDC9_205113 [bioreactor metagenome]|uniref:Uncharacterized protein n=1 Tax=bioreactor metagenome TaxID=1076179 RepID=A0A645J3Z9_9ZZZZ